MSLSVKSLAGSCIMWGDVMDASNYEQRGNIVRKVGWEEG